MILLMWILAQLAVEFYAEYYSLSSIDDEDSANFLK